MIVCVTSYTSPESLIFSGILLRCLAGTGRQVYYQFSLSSICHDNTAIPGTGLWSAEDQFRSSDLVKAATRSMIVKYVLTEGCVALPLLFFMLKSYRFPSRITHRQQVILGMIPSLGARERHAHVCFACTLFIVYRVDVYVTKMVILSSS